MLIKNRNDDIDFGHSFALPGLGTTLAASKPREACEEYVESIIEYLMWKRCPKCWSSTPAACGTGAASASASRALPGGKDTAPA